VQANRTGDALIDCFSEALGIDIDSVTEKLFYQSIEAWDSMGHMALVAAIEGRFDIVLDTDEILAMSSVAQAREILARHGVEVTPCVSSTTASP